jgi:hypothetical protein
MAKKSKGRCDQLPVLHRGAAGIDMGASELFVALPADRDLQPVRSFATFNSGSERASCSARAVWDSVSSNGVHERRGSSAAVQLVLRTGSIFRACVCVSGRRGDLLKPPWWVAMVCVCFRSVWNDDGPSGPKLKAGACQ